MYSPFFLRLYSKQTTNKFKYISPQFLDFLKHQLLCSAFQPPHIYTHLIVYSHTTMNTRTFITLSHTIMIRETNKFGPICPIHGSYCFKSQILIFYNLLVTWVTHPVDTTRLLIPWLIICGIRLHSFRLSSICKWRLTVTL